MDQRVSKLLQEHAVVLTTPPKEELKTMFPIMSWDMVKGDFFGVQMAAICTVVAVDFATMGSWLVRYHATIRPYATWRGIPDA